MPTKPNPADIKWDEKPDPTAVQWDEPAAPAPPPKSTDQILGENVRAKYAGMSALDKLKGDLGIAGDTLTRLGQLAVRGVNKGGTAMAGGMVADPLISARNAATGSSYQTSQQMIDEWLAKNGYGPPQNLPEAAIETGIEFAMGAKQPGSRALPAATPSPAQVSAETARGAGYKLPPSEIPNAGSIPKMVENLTGKTQMMARAADTNVPQTAINIARELELPPGTSITPDVLNAVRADSFAKGYAPIEALGQQYKDLIGVLRAARKEAAELFDDYAVNRRFETLQAARAANAFAQRAEATLEGAVRQINQPELYENYVRARMRIAKASDVERVLLKSRGDPQVKKLAREFSNDAPQSGAIEAAGRTGEYAPKAFVQRETPLLSGWDKAAGAGTMAALLAEGLTANPATRYGAQAGLGFLAARAGGTAASAAARKILLGDEVQDMMTFLTPEQKREALARAMATGLVPGAANAF